jgi:hypothetical protein
MKHHFPKRQAERKQMLARRKEEVFGIIPKPTTEKDNFKENFDKMIDTLSNIESSIDGGLNDNGGKLFEIVKNEDDHRYTSSSFLKKFDAKDK